ncbi:MAG: gas vesicle protein K [Calditrichota bacterium]
MNGFDGAEIESLAIPDFSRVIAETGGTCLQAVAAGNTTAAVGRGRKLNLDADAVKNGLGQLVLTVVKLLHELLERQALRRIDGGSLSDDEIERLGVTLMKQSEEIERLRKEFGLEKEDLNLDLGPLGKLL